MMAHSIASGALLAAAYLVTIVGSFAQIPRFTEPVYRASVPETYVEGGFERPPDGFVQVACINSNDGSALDATYVITDTNVRPFSLDPNTGALSVTADLDFETETFYSFSVACISTSDMNLNAMATIEITIESINEFEPQISSGLTVTFTEAVDVGALIVSHRPGEGIRQYSVSDGDDGPDGNVTFTFPDVNDPTEVMHFNLDLLTGDITLRERVDVDSVPGNLVTLGIIITACDRFPPEADCPNLLINFIVFAANDNQPSFSQNAYGISTPESTPLNMTFFTVECTDADVGVGEFQGIEIQNVTDPQMWTINSTDGGLKLNRQLDFETTQRYKFTLCCFDAGGRQDTVPVTVTVLPVNDIPPVFNITEYTFTASRLSPPGDEEVGQVTATDADLVIGNNITYSIQGNGNFAIDPNDGVITVSDYILNFEGRSFELTVIASDGIFQATASVEVTVEGLLSIPEIIIIAISGAVVIAIVCIFTCCCCYRFFPKWIVKIKAIPNYSIPSSVSQNIPTTPCVAYKVSRSAAIFGENDYEDLSFVRHDQAQKPPTEADYEVVDLSQESRQYDEIGSHIPMNGATQSEIESHEPMSGATQSEIESYVPMSGATQSEIESYEPMSGATQSEHSDATSIHSDRDASDTASK